MNWDVVTDMHVWEKKMLVSKRPELTNHVYAALARL